MTTETRPQDLLFTLYGEFLLNRGPVWVGSLIELLEPLGPGEGVVRVTLSRMVTRGWLRARRQGRRGYYELSGRGRALLEEGASRIYRTTYDATWDGEWTLLAYSIPESSRERRDRLRKRLQWLGFGSLGNGLWISPHDVAERARAVAAELGAADRLTVFRGREVVTGDASRLVRECWDLEGTNAAYEAFIDRHLGGCRAVMAGGEPEPREAYVQLFRLVHDYRQFPLQDPFLPRPLHGPEWAGECALALFRAYHDRLTPAAGRYLDEVVETIPAGRSRVRAGWR